MAVDNPRTHACRQAASWPGELQAGPVASSASGVGHAGPCTARMAALMGAIAHAAAGFSTGADHVGYTCKGLGDAADDVGGVVAACHGCRGGRGGGGSNGGDGGDR